MLNRDNTYLIGNKHAKGNKPNKTSFKKGIKVWNKGLKGVMKPNSGSFKKGQKGVNYKPLNTITKRKDKNGVLRTYIKVKEPNLWIEYSHFLWKKAGKKLKKGYCLHHINNNSADNRIENLILVSRQDHPKLHNRWNTKNIKSISNPLF